MDNVSQYQIMDIQNDLTGMLHGTSLNQITNSFGVFNRAARRLLEDVDPQETKIVTQFGKIYDRVFDYSIPEDVKGNKIIDIFPQANRQTRDYYVQHYGQDFDLWKDVTLTPNFQVQYAGGVRNLRITSPYLHTGISVNSLGDPTSNGTFTTIGQGNTIGSNNLYYVDNSSSSISFNLAQTVGASTGGVQCSNMVPVDLSVQFNNGDEFLWVYLPNASVFTSITLQWGSSSSNYYTGSVTTNFQGNIFVNGWNLIKFPWSTATTFGTPVNTAINFIQINFSYNGTLQVGVCVNQFWSRLGVIHNISYYSKYLFRNSITGVFQERTTNQSDYINLDTDAYNLLLWAVGSEATQQQQGLEALFFDNNYFEQRYATSLASYRGKYKSEIQKPGSSYYKKPSSNYRRFLGNGYRTP